MTRPDLHMHSSCSDGVCTPTQLLEEAQRAGLTVIALTDHDTFAGSDQLRGTATPMPVIPGVELSLNDLPGLHLLAYGLTDAPLLRERVAELARKRETRAAQMLDRLADLGMPLEAAELQRRCHGTVGRPHIARAMVHAGYVKSMQEAFDRYLGHDKPAYVSGERMSMQQALPLIVQSGFIPVLAHPCELHLEQPMLLALLEKWQAMGLRGIEVYHPSAQSCGYAALHRIARRMGLLVTGGSDFHQANDKHGMPGCTCSAWVSAESDMAALMKAMQ